MSEAAPQDCPHDREPKPHVDALERMVEAALFAAKEPLSVKALAQHLGDVASDTIENVLAALVTYYQGRGVGLVERGHRWHFETAADLAHLLRRDREEPRRLSRAATECLAIIAYHEPVSRAEIEAIRGVQTARGSLDALLEAGWIRIEGRREVPGRPVIYATTCAFLDHFGLASRRDLPGIDEMRAAGLFDPEDQRDEASLVLKEDDTLPLTTEDDAHGICKTWPE